MWKDLEKSWKSREEVMNIEALRRYLVLSEAVK
jgi:hypothetical protein